MFETKLRRKSLIKPNAPPEAWRLIGNGEVRLQEVALPYLKYPICRRWKRKRLTHNHSELERILLTVLR